MEKSQEETNIKLFKHIFKPLGKYVIVHSIGEISNGASVIALPDQLKETYKAHRIWEDNDNTVFAIGDEVTKIKIGDKIFLDAGTKLRKVKELTAIMEKKVGVSFIIEVKDKKNVLINTIEKEKYFAVLESDIITILN